MAEFLGWHIGDGCISTSGNKYQYTLTGDRKEEYDFYKRVVIPRFNKLFRDKIRFPAQLKEYSSVGVCGIYTSGKKLIQTLVNKYELPTGKKKNIEIPRVIQTREHKIRFLRGLFDTDGSVYFCRSRSKANSFYTRFHYKPKIKLACISKELICQVSTLIQELGFHARMYMPRKQRQTESTIYTVVVDRKGDTARWFKQIGSINPKHETKIEVWRKNGFCPPHTTIHERKEILSGKRTAASFYNNKL